VIEVVHWRIVIDLAQIVKLARNIAHLCRFSLALR